MTAVDRSVRSATLVVLSGGTEPALAAVADRYPEAEVETIDKEMLRGQKRYRTLRHLRRRRRDRFVYFTSVTAWQLDRFRMLAYGWLCGARRVALMDLEGTVEEFGFARIWLREAPRTLVEYVLAPLVLLAAMAASGLLLSIVDRAKRRTFARREGGPLDVLLLRPTPFVGVLEGGESAHIRGVLDGLTGIGHRVRVLSNDRLPAVTRAGHQVEVRRPGPAFNALSVTFEVWNNFVFALDVWRAVRRERPDMLYQRYSRNNWAGVLVSRMARIPLLLEWNGSEVWATKHWGNLRGARLAGLFERVNQRGADRIVVVSRALADALEAEGVPPERVVVNPNGVDPERFRPGAGGEEVRARYGLDGRVVVGFVGSFNHYQGSKVLMRAGVDVCGRSQEAHFLMVGFGDTLEPTRAIALEAGIEDRVTFTGRVLNEDVPRYVDACDIAVAPMVPNPDGSPFFNSPVKAFEYMAAGRAIVASRLGQLTEVLEDGETALLVEPDDPEALAEALVRLIEDRALRERLGLNARRAAVDRHTWRQNAARAVAAYEEVVGSR